MIKLLNMIEELLKLEEDPKILDFRFKLNNLPMWLFIRVDFLWHIIKKRYSLDEPHASLDLKKINFKKKISYLINSIKKFPFFIKKKYNVAIVGAAINNVWEEEYFTNRLYDLIYSIFPEDTILLEYSNRLFFYEPKKIKSYSIDIVLILRKLSKYLLVNKEDQKNIILLLNYLKDICDKNKILYDVKTLENFKHNLFSISKFIRINNILYSILIKKIEPKVLIIEDAHYGKYTDLIYLAKKKGIIILELQHGYIGKDHIAYNYHYSLHNYITEYLPDYFLTFGRFWSNNVRIPSKKVEIGFPYLEEKTKSLNLKKEKNKKYILIISSGILVEYYNQLVKDLYDLLDKNIYEIVFRPHPSERVAINERYNQIIKIGIKIDNDNLYKSLINYDIVLSFEKSTVLYEALAFNVKVILIRNPKNEFLEKKDDLFEEVDYNINEIINKIQNITYNSMNIEIEDIWKSNSLANYKKFIESILK